MPLTDGKHYLRALEERIRTIIPGAVVEDRGAATIVDLFRIGGQAVPSPADDDPAGAPVVARLNHGRWLGDCNLDLPLRPNPATGEVDPDAVPVTCRNAQLVDFTDPRFFCVVCHNAAVGGRWRPVTLPPNRAGIEALVEHLPTQAQNWEPPKPQPGGGA